MRRDDEDNRSYLTRLWSKIYVRTALGIAMFILAAASVVTQKVSTSAKLLTLFIVLLAVAFVIRALSPRTHGRRFRKLLRRHNPDAILATYADPLAAQKVEDGDAAYAMTAALFYAWYGEAAKARAILDEVDWSTRPPIVRSFRLAAEVRLHIFCEQDYEAALSAARRGRALADPGGDFPATAASDRAWNVMTKCCQLLAGRSGAEELVRELTDILNDKPAVGLEIVILWALVVAHEAAGDTKAGHDMRERYRALAPHCIAPPGIDRLDQRVS